MPPVHSKRVCDLLDVTRRGMIEGERVVDLSSTLSVGNDSAGVSGAITGWETVPGQLADLGVARRGR